MNCVQKIGSIASRVVLVLIVICMQGCMGREEQRHESPEQSSYFHNVVQWARSLVKTSSSTSHDITTIFSKKNVIPLVVIGSGPAGLGAAIYGARDNTETLVIEGQNPGGLLMYTTEVGNWGGEISILGPDIIKKLRNHAQALGAQFLADAVESVDFSQWPFELKTLNGKIIHALSVVIATGASPRKLEVEGEKEYTGFGLTYCAKCDALFFKDKDVVVVGGGDSAIEEALQLDNHVKSVTILVRKESFRAAASMQDRIKDNPKIKVLFNSEIKKINGTKGDNLKVTSIDVLNNKTQEVSTMPIDGIFVAVGHTPNSELFKGQLDINDHGYIKTLDCTHKTSVPGVFAAGEIEDYRYRQGWSSGGRGTEAALDALAFLRSLGFNTSIGAQLKEQRAEMEEEGAEYELASVDSYAHLVKRGKASSLPIVLDFWSQDCPSCLAMLPVISAVAQKYQKKAQFFKVNAAGDLDSVNDLVLKYKIERIPTVIVIHKGKILGSFSGVKSKKEVEEFLNPLIEAAFKQK